MANEIRNWFLKDVAAEFLPGDFAVDAISDNVNTETEFRDIPNFPRSMRIPLSSFQNRLWFTQTLANDTTLFNCRLRLMIRGKINVECLKLAWSQIKRVNAAFRTAFVDGVDGPEQRIVDQLEVEIPLYDLSSERDSGATLHDPSRSIQPKEFQLEKGECFRLALVKLESDTHCLIFIVHHLVFDRGSCFRLLDQMTDTMGKKASPSNDDALRWASIRAFFNTGHVYWALDTSNTMKTLRELGIDTGKCPPVGIGFLKRLYHNWTVCPERSKMVNGKAENMLVRK
ncbi:hypothetical protein F4678DRAFT_483326 [Xylaria arbuscula]|nr:hypothetical protein F4678DRAFT_483326 [Xylaria arbuscula]